MAVPLYLCVMKHSLSSGTNMLPIALAQSLQYIHDSIYMYVVVHIWYM